ncbi:hypothetical protein [Bartonella tribocorum]|nr:hypothetical protein [Bartonella tribocorum]
MREMQKEKQWYGVVTIECYAADMQMINILVYLLSIISCQWK